MTLPASEGHPEFGKPVQEHHAEWRIETSQETGKERVIGNIEKNLDLAQHPADDRSPS